MGNSPAKTKYDRILVIRRDNIGDLVCTTPLLAAMRERFSRAWIGLLANSYNAPVLSGNPDVDEVYAYRKLKHVTAEAGALSTLADRVGLIWKLRHRKLDLVVLAAGAHDRRGAQFAKLLAPQRTLSSQPTAIGMHEVERTFSAARSLGIEGAIPPLKIVPDKSSLEKVRGGLERAGVSSTRPLIGMHISARRAAQRWPARHFADLAIALQKKHGAAILLFWSPGGTRTAGHPGDDDKAVAVLEMVSNRAQLIPWPTSELSDLIAGLAACNIVICSDGGAMHIAAALGKPILCFFGDSPVDRWRPWGVRHIVVRAQSGNVADISVEETLLLASQLLGT